MWKGGPRAFLCWGSRAFNWAGGSTEPSKTGGGGSWEKGSIDRAMNQLL